MPESPFAKSLMALLKAMDNFWLVLLLAGLVLLVRIAWSAYRKRNPLPSIPAPPPPDHARTWLSTIIGLLGAGYFSVFVHVSFMYAILGGLAFYWITDAVYGWRTAQPIVPQRAPVPRSQGKGKRSRGSVTPTDELLVRQKDLTLEIIDTLLIAIILVFGLVRPFFMSTFFIPSGSMETTLLGPVTNENPWLLNPGKQVGGDKLIASKFVYLMRPPRRFEVAVFRPVRDAFIPSYTDETQVPGMVLTHTPVLLLREWMEKTPGALKKLNPNLEEATVLAALPPFPSDPDDFIKRVIGVGGDTIRVVAHDGVYVNGKRLDDRYVDCTLLEPDGKTVNEPAPRDFPVVIPPPPDPPRLADYTSEEEWESKFFSWLEVDNPASSTWCWHSYYRYTHLIGPFVQKDKDGHNVYVVPQGHIFLMGDNRAGSFDSRYWGAVPVTNARARALATFWPLDRLRLL